MAIYDCLANDEGSNYRWDGHYVGFSVSSDGIHWPRGQKVDVQPGDANWSSDLRTPLCLIPEGNDVYTVVYTARLKEKKFYPVGLVKLKLVRENDCER